MSSIAAFTKGFDDLTGNIGAIGEALINAKQRERGEIEARWSRQKAAREAEAKREDEEFQADLDRNRGEEAKIAEWFGQIGDDIRLLKDGDNA